MKVCSSSRSRSGEAWASCSSSSRAGSILNLTVTVVSFLESVVRDHSKDHLVAVAHVYSDTLTRTRTPLLDSTTGSGSGAQPVTRPNAELTVGLEPTTACLQGRRWESTEVVAPSQSRLCASSSRPAAPLLSALLSTLPPCEG